MRYLPFFNIAVIALYASSSECAPLKSPDSGGKNIQRSDASSAAINQSLSAISNSSPLSCLTIPDISSLDGCTLYTPDPDFDPTEPNAPPFQLMTGDGRYVLQASMKSDGMPFFLIAPNDPISNPFLQIFAYNPNDKMLRLAIDNTFLLSLRPNSTLSLVQQYSVLRPPKNTTGLVPKDGSIGPCELVSQDARPVLQPASVSPLAFFASKNGTLLGSLTEDVSLAYDISYELISMPYKACICQGVITGGQLWQMAPVICDIDKSHCKCKCV